MQSSTNLTSPSLSSYTYSCDDPPDSDEDMYLQSRSRPDDGSVVAFQGTIDSSSYADYTSVNTITVNAYGTPGLKSSGFGVLDTDSIPGPDDNVYYSNLEDATDISSFIYNI
ncbi:hypothetical protein B7494_g4915 [Chlorociboria aeruginascens]|nr:hypothetical protein B7494_g4915 [Chlorociboria aeruginascens]